jgi:ubiquinone/menaquinone biosynthesis C-methylase UbiE
MSAMHDFHTDEEFKLRDATSYDHVIDEFDRFTERFTPPLARRLVELAAPRPGERVLDIGTGLGIVAFEALEHVRPEGEVLGIDLSTRMIASASAKRLTLPIAAQHAIAFEEMDAEALALEDESFDVVVSLFALLHFPNPDVALREMKRVLRPGGRLVIAVGSRPPLLDANGFRDHVAQLGRIASQMRGKRVTAPALLDALVERMLPSRGGPEESPLAAAGRQRSQRVPRLVRDAGFTSVRSTWEGHQSVIDSAEEFWDLQRTFSSIARKRLEASTRAEVEPVRAAFMAECKRVQSAGGQLVYPHAALFVSAVRP